MHHKPIVNYRGIEYMLYAIDGCALLVVDRATLLDDLLFELPSTDCATIDRWSAAVNPALLRSNQSTVHRWQPAVQRYLSTEQCCLSSAQICSCNHRPIAQRDRSLVAPTSDRPTVQNRRSRHSVYTDEIWDFINWWHRNRVKWQKWQILNNFNTNNVCWSTSRFV